MDPLTLALTGGATLLQAGGTYFAGKAAKAAGDFNLRMSETDAATATALAGYNAAVLRQNAEFVREATADDLKNFSRQVGFLVEEQAAGYVAGGVRVGVGSTAEVRRATLKLADEEATRRFYIGEVEAAKYESAARMAEYEGEVSAWRSNASGLIAQAEGKSNKKASGLGALGQLIAGGAKIAGLF